MLDLLDYRRRVSDIYASIRAGGSNETTHAFWRQRRDELFSCHPQSALSAGQRRAFAGLSYFRYDPAYDLLGDFQPNPASPALRLELGDDGATELLPFGEVSIDLPQGPAQLTAYWISGYGGGIFIPFGDSTNGRLTYGGGRYLYDSIKGADLGTRAGKLIMNFNYAFNPSCAYNARWICPLPPQQNKLALAIPAGERFGGKP